MHRDPLGLLREAQLRFGDVFTVRLATARPIVVVAAPGEVTGLLDSDPAAARAGEARRRVLPMASDRSIFGGDGRQHSTARGRVAAAFSPTVAGRRAAMVAIAERHADGWPRRWPVRGLPRMRALVDDVFVRVLLGVANERRARALTVAIRRMLWTPGNPPLSIPGEGDGLLGAVTGRAFERRVAPLAALLADEITERRRHEGPGEDVIDRLPQLGSRAAYAKQAIRDALIKHREYINERGEDHPIVLGWRWGGKTLAPNRSSTEADNV